MSSELLEPVVRSVVNRLVSGEYADAVQDCPASRLTADDLLEAVQDYGRTLIEPPPDAYRDLDVVAVRDSSHPTWSVRAPLWSREEGRSDLTLELTISRDGGRWEVEIDDLRLTRAVIPRELKTGLRHPSPTRPAGTGPTRRPACSRSWQARS